MCRGLLANEDWQNDMTTRSRITAMLFAATLGAVGLVGAVAAPAGAATQTITIDCTSRAAVPPWTNLTVSPGDTLILQGAGCGSAYTNPTYGFLFDVTPTDGIGAGPYTWAVSADAPLGTYGAPNDDVIEADSYPVTTCNGDTPASEACGEYFYITIVAAGAAESGMKDLTVWHQSVGRASAYAPCAEGYRPSWAAWPNGGSGGWVCNKDIYAYYPDEPVL
jgi:hypothetical protein